jgi:hypothetical protein
VPGVYSRTETVQVTRSTSYVDRSTENGNRRQRRPDNDYNGGYGGRGEDNGRDWSPPSAPPSPSPDPYEESFTDRKLRERYGRRPRPYGDEPWNRDADQWRPVSSQPISGEPISAEPSRRGRRRAPDWDDDDPLTGPISERWAAARSEDNGHSDDYRRSDDYSRPDYGHSDDRGRNDYGQSDYSRDGYGRSDYGRPDYARPALPAGGSEPSWNDSWDEPEREPEPEPVREPVRESRGRRRADDDTGTGHQRRLDFELSDERWR